MAEYYVSLSESVSVSDVDEKGHFAAILRVFDFSRQQDTRSVFGGLQGAPGPLSAHDFGSPRVRYVVRF